MGSYTCLACTLAKRNKPPIISGGGERKENLRPGEIISADPVGKISPSSANGYCYFFLFKDIAILVFYTLFHPKLKSTSFLR